MAKKKRPTKKTPAKKPAAAPEPTTIAELAAAIGVHERTFASWRRRGCPQGPIAEIEKWRALNMVAKSEDASLNPLTRLKKRKLRVDIREREIRTAKLEEKMILREDALRVFEDYGIAVKNELEKFPDAMEMEFPRQHRTNLKQTLTHRINQLLQRMSTWKI